MWCHASAITTQALAGAMASGVFRHTHFTTVQALSCMTLPCRLMVKLVGCVAVCERMNENSAAGTHRVTLLSSTTLLVFLQAAK